MKLCIIGLGYIGLPTAAMFSNHGCKVVGVDVKEEVVNTLNSGKIHIKEPGLQEMIEKAVKEKSFKASLTPEEADAFIIAVPTPNKEDKYLSCDLTYVLQACEKILPYVRKGNTIIIESTIAPRSTDDYIKPLFEKAGFVIGEDLYLAHCPERVLPGKILYELVNNNRIVGGITPKCTEMAAKVYGIFVKGELIKTEAKTAEMSKCMENTFRDVNIALANELAKICDKLDINCLDVIAMANKHPRVNIHQPGPGVGGHCLAVDPYFVSAEAPEESTLIRLAREINNGMPEFVADKVKTLVAYDKKAKIAVLGVTYKGNVDDIRESPALKIIDILKSEGYNLAICDPYVKGYSSSIEETLENASLALILVDHNEFKDFDYDKVADKMKKAVLFDTRNIVKAEKYNKIRVINYGNM